MVSRSRSLSPLRLAGPLAVAALLAGPIVAPAAGQLAGTPLPTARPHAAPHPLGGLRLLAATTTSGGDGAVVSIAPHPPWPVTPLAATDGGEMLRVFGPHVFVINRWDGTLTRFRLDSTEAPVVYALGDGSEPMDVHVVGGVAWVTRRHDSRLLRIELSSGAQQESVDLLPLAEPNEVLTLGTLERDGDRLFVQVGLLLRTPVEPPAHPDRGLLGVVDLDTETLVDVEPLVPGVQGVALDGAPPHLKMQILDEVRTLYVSTTLGVMDDRGGIEMVDLDRLESVGYALSEEQIADIGGFVMTSPEGGYFLFHTDIVISSHLEPFTVAGGPHDGPEMIVLLIDRVDSLAYDAARHRLYLPSGTSDPTGLHVFDTLTQEPLPTSPIPTGRTHDVVLVSE